MTPSSAHNALVTIVGMYGEALAELTSRNQAFVTEIGERMKEVIALKAQILKLEQEAKARDTPP